MSEHHLSSTQFTSLSLRDELLKGLDEAGFEYCTPIQEASLPIALESRDVAGQAQTGTGKTAAFLLATFQHLLNTPADERRRTSPRAMILAPTRELAIQIYKDAEVFGKHTGLSMGVVYGGTGYEQQKQMLADGLDIVIGTPGRLIDYYKQKIYGLKDIQVMVLDEADRMFDLGFIKDIRYLLRRMPPPEQRLGLLYSATLSYRVTELAYEHMNNPELVKIEADSVTADKVKQIAYFTANEEKIPLLIGLLKGFDDHRSIVFVNTKRAADRVWGYLEGNGLSTAVLSGDVPQKKRQALLNRFQSGELSILVATDVAARGLHIPEVTHVINYDLPQDAEDYVHRIGRTARAGATGDAISFVCEDYAFSMPEIEEYIGQKVPMEALDEEQLAEVEPPKKRERRPRDDKRSNSRSGRGRQRRPYPQNGDGQNKAEGEKPKQQADKPADSEGEPKKRRRRRRRKPSGEAQGQNGQQTQTQTAKPDSPSES